MYSSAIIIPARYASTRFPGKPLAKIGERTMLQCVCDVALTAAQHMENTRVMVATEDERIYEYASNLGVQAVMTAQDCSSGSDRCLLALQAAGESVDFVFNLQGDAPFTPAEYLIQLWQVLCADERVTVATPVVQLPWAGLDALRQAKQTTPFSGTTAVIDAQGKARWFSKNILPAIRPERTLRESQALSPVYQHVGLYAFRYAMLQTYVTLPQTPYEQLEGLEQLRLLEHGYDIQAVIVQGEHAVIPMGIDTPEDLQRAKMLLAQ